MHVGPALLEREEGGVEAGQPVGIRHRPPIVADAAVVPQFTHIGSKPCDSAHNVRHGPAPTSAIPQDLPAGCTTSTPVGCTPPRSASPATRRRRRTSSRTSSSGVWRKPRSFDAPSRRASAPYLRLMARSRALDLWREGQAAGRASDRLKVVVGRGGGAHGRPAGPPPSSSRTTARSWGATPLRKLPEAQREALVLAYWGGLTADQIAQRSQVPLGTAKSRIRLGLAQASARSAGTPSCRPPDGFRPGRRYPRTLVRPPSRRARGAADGGTIAGPGRGAGWGESAAAAAVATLVRARHSTATGRGREPVSSPRRHPGRQLQGGLP